MVTKQELVNGYEIEIKYQRHMLENLGRWFSLLFITASIGVVLMVVFGYGIYRGRINLQKVIDDFNQKLTILN